MVIVCDVIAVLGAIGVLGFTHSLTRPSRWRDHG